MVVAATPAVRETLARSLWDQGASEVTEAASIAEARVRAAILGPLELCIVDAELPDGSGADLMNELRAVGWSRGVMLSSTDDFFSVHTALKTGVRAFLVTPAAAEPPHRYGSGPAKGKPRLRRAISGRLRGAAGLSTRELEIIALVEDGRPNKTIAKTLGLSHLTVKSHLGRISQKLGSGDRAEIVIITLRSGRLPAPAAVPTDARGTVSLVGSLPQTPRADRPLNATDVASAPYAASAA